MKENFDYWFCSLSYYLENRKDIESNGWEFVGYSEYGQDGIPRIAELKKVFCRIRY